MIRILITLTIVLLNLAGSLAQSDAEMIRKVYDEILQNGQAYEQLGVLTKTLVLD